MPVNPSTRPEHLTSAAARTNSVNDPQVFEHQGYFPYDLTHQEFITPRFGQIVPSMHLDTVPGDRHLVHDNVKTVLNQINGNFLSTVNQYVDSFYIPAHCLMPHNYDRLIPNPTKGDDLPASALPQFPLFALFADYLDSLGGTYHLTSANDYYNVKDTIHGFMDDPFYYPFSDNVTNIINAIVPSFAIGRLSFLAYILSRGQLLDYLGIQLDSYFTTDSNKVSILQEFIDDFFRSIWLAIEEGIISRSVGIQSVDITADSLHLDDFSEFTVPSTLSEFREAFDEAFERGKFVCFLPVTDAASELKASKAYSNLKSCYTKLRSYLLEFFSYYDTYEFQSLLHNIDTETDPFKHGFINLFKPLAYQMSVSHYFTNDSVDNIFTADLFMENLRSVMFPVVGNIPYSREPVFDYNGVQMEYDYITTGAFRASLWSRYDGSYIGVFNRQFVFMSLMFLCRRSLRYGDYFASARPRMLAVGQLGVNVTDGIVSPVDMTQNLLKQRYLNFANRVGMREPNYYLSTFGVEPSDLGCIPRFLAHRKIVLQNQITNNTSENQGYQTTNLVGYADSNGFDVYIDDFGVILSLVSFDVLPVYCSGIDASYHLADRYDFFNPLLQNIGDVPILQSEIYGDPQRSLHVFGYTMRDKVYKFKVSRAHGAFVNSLPGFLMKYPLYDFHNLDDTLYTISPSFIRDKPSYFDAIVPQMTGISPGEYYHFVCACVNQVKSARKIQAQPPVLF